MSQSGRSPVLEPIRLEQNHAANARRELHGAAAAFGDCNRGCAFVVRTVDDDGFDLGLDDISGNNLLPGHELCRHQLSGHASRLLECKRSRRDLFVLQCAGHNRWHDYWHHNGSS